MHIAKLELDGFKIVPRIVKWEMNSSFPGTDPSDTPNDATGRPELSLPTLKDVFASRAAADN